MGGVEDVCALQIRHKAIKPESGTRERFEEERETTYEIQIEAITIDEFPPAEGPILERFDRPSNSQEEL